MITNRFHFNWLPTFASRKQPSRQKNFQLSLVLATGFLLLCACDHGIRYRPKGWSSTQAHRWDHTFENIDIEMPEIGGLIGNDSLMLEIVIHNRANSMVVLESAVLKTRLSDYTARPTEYERKWEPIPSGETRSVTLVLEFSRPIRDVLKDPVELRFKFRIGNEESEFSVPMERS